MLQMRFRYTAVVSGDGCGVLLMMIIEVPLLVGAVKVR